MAERAVGLEVAISNKEFDPMDLRRAMGRFATGVTVITTRHEDHTHGMTANAFMSVSLDPPLVLVSLENRTRMHQLLPSVGRFGVSVLAENQSEFSKHFAGRPVHGLDVRFHIHGGVPLLEGAVARFVLQVVNTYPAGDHTLYIGRVEHFEWREGKPLIFYSGAYQQLPDGR